MRTLNSELSSLLDRGLHEELINDIIECQLDQWPMAADNYHRLSHSERKPLPLKAIRGSAQWNPARIVSTGAKTDAKSIAERKCFLCSENRPEEQFSIPWLGDWELLVNPFPILPVHFTIASLSHRPQGKLPLEMAAMAEQAPDLVIFYNGARSGASAPDHQHAQAVLSSELPLMRTVEAFHPLEEQRILGSNELGGEFPFLFYSAVVPPGPEGMSMLATFPLLGGIDAETGTRSPELMNAFFWMDRGWLRVVIIPRKAHRPSIYYANGAEQMLISPGAIDMAGLLILPRKDDFERITPEIAEEVYADVAYSNQLS